MSIKITRKIFKNTEDERNSHPSATEFEMAYQSRIAIDRIRFAIKHSELFGQRTEASYEAGMQLLDALQRLETVDLRFKERSRNVDASARIEKLRAHSVMSGTGSVPTNQGTSESTRRAADTSTNWRGADSRSKAGISPAGQREPELSSEINETSIYDRVFIRERNDDASWALFFADAYTGHQSVGNKPDSTQPDVIGAETPKGDSSQITATDAGALV